MQIICYNQTMGRGKKNNSTTDSNKNKIIEVATKYFYEQGYTNTFFEQIAEACNISSPLISYHFNRKSALAKAVSDKYTGENKNRIAFKVYKSFYGLRKYDLQYSTAVEILLTNRLIHEDKKVMRFMKERADSYYEDMQSQSTVDLYRIHDRRYHLDINRDNDEISMLAFSAAGASLALRIAYYRGYIDCSFDEFNDYATAVHFRVMNLEKAKIDEILKESHKIIDQLDFKILPYFKIV